MLGLARDLPEAILDIISEVERHIGQMPYGIDLMPPSKMPQEATCVTEGLK